MGVSLCPRWPSRLCSTWILSPPPPFSLPPTRVTFVLVVFSPNQHLCDEAFLFPKRRKPFFFSFLDCREIWRNIRAVIICNPSAPLHRHGPSSPSRPGSVLHIYVPEVWAKPRSVPSVPCVPLSRGGRVPSRWLALRREVGAVMSHAVPRCPFGTGWDFLSPSCHMAPMCC